MNSSRNLIFSLVVLISSHAQTYGDDPASRKSIWRIPQNHVAYESIEWLVVRHADDESGERHVNIEAAIGDCCSYEMAWNYYAERLRRQTELSRLEEEWGYQECTLCPGI